MKIDKINEMNKSNFTKIDLKIKSEKRNEINYKIKYQYEKIKL